MKAEKFKFKIQNLQIQKYLQIICLHFMVYLRCHSTRLIAFMRLTPPSYSRSEEKINEFILFFSHLIVTLQPILKEMI